MFSKCENGFLDFHRKNTSFTVKKLKLYFEGEQLFKYKEKAYKDLLLELEEINIPKQQTANQLKEWTFRTHKNLLKHIEVCKKMSLAEIPFYTGLFSIPYAPAIIKRILSYEININFIRIMSKQADKKNIIENISSGKWHSCIALTEIGHGSNLMKLQTRAQFNVQSQTFVLNTPSITAWKCWVGNLGKHATHALVLAQLYTPDNQCHGIHWFFVPIRDPNTMKPYPGITVGDIGEKISRLLNGLDNGFVAFNDYHIPKTALLNAIADVTPEGHFITSCMSPQKNFAMSVRDLTYTRCFAVAFSFYQQLQGITIAIRYAAVRRQFGPSSTEPEMYLISYPLHQRRLFPYLSSTFVHGIVLRSFLQQYSKCHQKLLSGENSNEVDIESADCHLVMSGLKAIFTWEAQNCLQESRECCGGHGYLQAAGLGDLRDINDAFVTLEGDNNVLLLSVCKTLLKAYEAKQKGFPLHSKMELYGFIDHLETTLSCTNNNLSQLITVDEICRANEWLICYFLRENVSKLREKMRNGLSFYEAFNVIQVFDGKSLAIAFTQNFIICQYFQFLNQNKPPDDCRNVLMSLGLLYSLCTLEKHFVSLCKGGYFRDMVALDIIRDNIFDVCMKLKNDAVSLIDVLAPPDEFINSVLGKSDGQVYERLISTFLKNNSIEYTGIGKEVNKPKSRL